MNPKLWNKTAPLGRIEDYDKILPIVEVYRCVQSEGSRFGRVILVREVGVIVGILLSIRKKEDLALMTLLKFTMRILTLKK